MSEVNTTREFLLQYLQQKVELRKGFAADKINLPVGFNYYGIEDFLLDTGQFWTPAKTLPHGIGRMIPKQCFDNVYRLVMRRKSLRYVEGFATSVFPIHHAWAVDKHGVVVDPTWELDNEKYPREYFGTVFDVKDVQQARRNNRNTSVLDDWTNDFPVLRRTRQHANNIHRSVLNVQ